MQVQPRKPSNRPADRSPRTRAGARPRAAARLPRDVLMKMLMADIALLDRLESVCRADAPHDATARQRLDAAAAMAHQLAASKEALAAALLSLALDETPTQ